MGPFLLRPVCLLFLVLLAFLNLVGAEPVMAQSAAERVAVTWVSQIKRGEFAAAGAQVAPLAEPALGAKALPGIWKGIEGKLGQLVGLGPGTVTRQGELRLVDLRGDFQRGRFTVRVVLNREDRVAGFFVQPWTQSEIWKAAAYVDPEAFVEHELEVGAPGWPLPATLTVPKGEGPFPGALLVHGSGPHDRDESLGPSRPFRDLAWGLASRGIAVLRYEKRTLEHGRRIGTSPTLDEEVIDDAVAALATLRARPETVPGRLVVVGHSLGGMLGPRIAARDGQLAGLVALAAPARPYTTIFREQLAYLSSLGQPQAADALEVVDAWSRGEGNLESLGLPDAYLAEVDAVRAATEARGFDSRLLVLQGGRDYQVTREDFALWKAAHEDREQATLRLFPDLDHRFVAGQGKGRPEEYQTLGHVDARVIEAIASWLAETGK